MMKLNCYSKVEDVPNKVWEDFVSRETVGLELDHLKAIEYSGINGIHPYYFIGFDDEKPVGIAYCFTVMVDLASMANNYPSDVLNTVKSWNPGFMNLRVLEVGHIASLGSTIKALPNYSKQFIKILAEKFDEIGKLENIDLCLIRDIPPDDYNCYSELEKNGYHPTPGFPIARMKLNWGEFNDYLSALKSKKRYNIKKRVEKLKAPEINVEVIDDYAPFADKLSELWFNVAKKNNGYQHEQLTPEYFKSMATFLKDRSHVVAIKKDDKIIAFTLNLIGNDEYFGVSEGLDYSFRDKYELYANNMFEGLRMACQLKKKVFNIGITSYDFKTFIGAEPEPVIYLVKAMKKNQCSAAFANFIGKNIIQAKTEHKVFRDDEIPEQQVTAKYEETTCNSLQVSDPFSKHIKFLRANEVRSVDLYPYFPVFESAQEPIINHNGKQIIMLGTNSYMGLATHPKIIDSACRAIQRYGTGCSGSPLLNGTLDLHTQLSDKIANFLSKEDALLFSTGYQTNVGAISAIVNRNDILIMDERNHASLVDGARLSGAKLVRYKHNDTQSLENVLRRFTDDSKLIVTDSLFSMEGTLIDLPKIVDLAKKYHARLMLDESHAIGVFGKTGRGVAEHFELIKEVDLIMGTFSKSFASIGGFVAGDHIIIDSLKHNARSHIFSASLPPASVAAVLTAIEIIDDEPWRRKQLMENAYQLSSGLKKLGFKIHYNNSPIIGIHCGHELLTLAAYQELFNNGVFVNPVMSPAIPKNEEMLRVSVMATHTKEILDNALEVFGKIRTSYWPKNN